MFTPLGRSGYKLHSFDYNLETGTQDPLLPHPDVLVNQHRFTIKGRLIVNDLKPQNSLFNA